MGEIDEPGNPFIADTPFNRGLDAPHHKLDCRLSPNADGTVTVYFVNVGDTVVTAPVVFYAQDDASGFSKWMYDDLKPGETDVAEAKQATLPPNPRSLEWPYFATISDHDELLAHRPGALEVIAPEATT